MNFDTLKAKLPEHAKDIKLNLERVLSPEGAPDLSAEQIYGIALASAYATRQSELILLMVDALKESVPPTILIAAETATIIMAMNNIYYRFTHLASDKSYLSMPVNLRMNAIANSGVKQIDFELYSLAISAINGCGLCIDAHVRKLEQEGISKLGIQSSIRIAAVINAAAMALSLKQAHA